MKKFFLLAVLFLFIAFDVVYGQCAMCKANLESNLEEEVSFGNSINTGIIMLMIVPYIILFLLFRKKIKAGFQALFK